MNLSDEAQRHWELVQAFKAVVHRGDVTDDLFDVDGSLRLGGMGFELKQVDQRGLSALDLAREGCFSSHKASSPHAAASRCLIAQNLRRDRGPRPNPLDDGG